MKSFKELLMEGSDCKIKKSWLKYKYEDQTRDDDWDDKKKKERDSLYLSKKQSYEVAAIIEDVINAVKPKLKCEENDVHKVEKYIHETDFNTTSRAEILEKLITHFK